MRVAYVTILLMLAGCTEPGPQAATDAGDDPADPGNPSSGSLPAPESSPDAQPLELDHLSWTFNGTADALTAHFSFGFGEGNPCRMQSAVAAHPLTAGYWSIMVASAVGDSFASNAHSTFFFDTNGPGDDGEMVSYHALGVASSSVPAADHDVALGIVMEATMHGDWDLTLLVEEPAPWVTDVTENNTVLVDVRCRDPFEVYSALEGAQAIISSFDGGDGLGVSIQDRGAVQVADGYSADLTGIVSGVMAESHTGAVGTMTAEGPDGLSATAIAPATSPGGGRIRLEGGPGTYTLERSQASPMASPIAFYSFNGPITSGSVLLE